MRPFAEWLVGLAAQQPREYRRLLRIRRRIYRKIAPLRAEVVSSVEPIPFGEIPHGRFRPIHAGGSWGGVLDSAWLHLTGDVPPGVRNPIVMLGIRGEGLVFSPAGEILDAVTTVFQQGDLPHSGGRAHFWRTA